MSENLNFPVNLSAEKGRVEHSKEDDKKWEKLALRAAEACNAYRVNQTEKDLKQATDDILEALYLLKQDLSEVNMERFFQNSTEALKKALGEFILTKEPQRYFVENEALRTSFGAFLQEKGSADDERVWAMLDRKTKF